MTSQDRTDVEPVDAIVLAGSVNRIALFPGNRPGRKALVEIAGKPLMAYVLDALTASRYVRNIVVVGAPEVIEYASRWPRVVSAPEGLQLLRNAWRGMRAAGTDRVLFCNPDQPLLTTEMVDDFVERAVQVEGDLISSWVRREDLGRYTEGDHKFANFGDGRFAHGNLFLVRRDMPEIEKVRARLDRLYQARKNNLRFAWELGPRLFARFLVAKFSGKLPDLAATLELGGRAFGLRVTPVICPFPEIALDIDEPEDYAAAVRYLADAEKAAAPVGSVSGPRERVTV
jgi:CTP:molybdopterin cytidylyltransferase MocA